MKIVNPKAVLGENAACRYLEDKEYTIIERNYRKGYGEIDIIAVHDQTLVFVEVKTRFSSAYGSPFESISRSKLATFLKTALLYKNLHKNLPDDMRIDAVGVTLWADDRIEKIEHLENITG